MMLLFMGSWSIGFVALIAAHLYMRLDAVAWPPAGAPAPPTTLMALSTGFAVASSLAYHRGLLAIELNRPRALWSGLLAATALSFLFMFMQLGAGVQASMRGLTWSSGVYGAFFWVVAGFHLAHVVVGFVAGIWLLAQTRAGAFSSGKHLPVRLWGYYWHSIGAAWIAIYLFIFVL